MKVDSTKIGGLQQERGGSPALLIEEPEAISILSASICRWTKELLNGSKRVNRHVRATQAKQDGRLLLIAPTCHLAKCFLLP
jgi:hypothetical protein